MDRRAIWIVRWSCVTTIMVLVPDGARAQAPEDATPPPAVATRRGPLHRLFHHSAYTMQD